MIAIFTPLLLQHLSSSGNVTVDCKESSVITTMIVRWLNDVDFSSVLERGVGFFLLASLVFLTLLDAIGHVVSKQLWFSSNISQKAYYELRSAREYSQF